MNTDVVERRIRALFHGTWRIIAMEQWGQDYIDEEEPGFVRFDDDETGEFHFGNAQGMIDYEIVPIPDGQRLDFSWDGNDEMDEETGRGWAEINGEGTMIGKITFHFGERSWFRAGSSK